MTDADARTLAGCHAPDPALFDWPAREAGPLVLGASATALTCLVRADSAAAQRLAFVARGSRARGPGGLVLDLEREALADLARQDTACAAVAAALRAFEAPRERALVMGVLNVTPDSFSDGGRHQDRAAAVEHGLRLAAEGADLLDVGGESTRPGAAPVAAAEELRRVLPVVEELVAALPGVPVSIDTTKASVARAAVAAGARVVNDISGGLQDPEMLGAVADLDVEYVAMHRQGRPADMQAAPRYEDALLDVTGHLRERVAACLEAGIRLPKICLDPGVGFGKRVPHNLALLARTDALRSLGLPVLVGASRKAFIAHVMGAEREQDWASGHRADRPEDRLGGTAAAVTQATLGGARVLRVHDVAMMVEAIRVAEALARARDDEPR